MNRFIPTTSSSLLVKHIPVILSDGALQEFFQHFGAKEIQLMKGKMHGTALLKFNEPHSALKALSDLNNLKLLNKQLVVDFAEEEKPAKKSTAEPTPAASNEQQAKQPEIGFPIAKNLGIDWPSPPYLEYSYPPPSRDIAENIVRLLFHVPKFYEQVLHLMNKMNLPPPFGPAFPMANRVKKSLDPTRKRKRTPESVNNTVEEFESESSESDLDEDEQNRDKKRSRKSNEAEQEEGARHIPIDQQQPASSILGPSIRAQGTAKPLQISFKTTQLQPPLANAPMMQQGPGRPMMVPGPGPNNMMPNMGNVPPNMMGQFNPYMPPNNGSNVNIPVEYIQGQATPGQVVGADVRNVITLQQLMANRQTVDEIRMMEKFKNYAPGEPSEKLFVRNLEKRVTIEDLKFIFGRYIPTDDDMDKELDVKLMTTGRLKGQAFVTFTNIQRSQQALNEVNGYVLYDRPLVIEFGRKKE